MEKNKPNINMMIVAHRELIKRSDKPLNTAHNNVGEFGEVAIGFIWLHSSTLLLTKMNNSAQKITTSAQVTQYDLFVVSQRARSLFITPAENPPRANLLVFFFCFFGSLFFWQFFLLFVLSYSKSGSTPVCTNPHRHAISQQR